MQININAQQAQVLLGLIDLAVKSAGLQAAEAGTFFSRIIREAAAAESGELPEESPAEQVAS